MPNPTFDEITGLPISPDDDYDYVADPLRNDPKRHLPKDVDSVTARQKEAASRGVPYYPSPWECQELGKWWVVPEDEQEELMRAETPRHAWVEMIEPRLADPSLYHGSIDETPTAWDGMLTEHANWGNIVTTTRIGVQWLQLRPEALGKGTNATKTISTIMRSLGWTTRRQRVEGMRVAPHVWVVSVPSGTVYRLPSDGTDENSENGAGSVRNDIRTDDDDIPF